MRYEPPIDQPVHRFEDVESVDMYCDDCDADYAVAPDSLELDGVSVVCPSCGLRLFVVDD